MKPSQGPNSQQEVTSFVKECGILRRLNHRWALWRIEIISVVEEGGMPIRMLCRQ